MRSEEELESAFARYGDTVRRICLCYLKDRADSEDIFQTVFLKYLLYEGDFAGEEHEKAWLIRVTVNACKDHLRSLLHRSTLPLEVLKEETSEMDEESREVLEAVLSLGEKYRAVIYLHYYEGYSAGEIGRILGKREGTVFSLLSRARAMLRDKLGGDGL